MFPKTKSAWQMLMFTTTYTFQRHLKICPGWGQSLLVWNARFTEHMAGQQPMLGYAWWTAVKVLFGQVSEKFARLPSPQPNHYHFRLWFSLTVEVQRTVIHFACTRLEICGDFTRQRYFSPWISMWGHMVMLILHFDTYLIKSLLLILFQRYEKSLVTQKHLEVSMIICFKK